jgi:hypothetical protein
MHKQEVEWIASGMEANCSDRGYCVFGCWREIAANSIEA